LPNIIKLDALIIQAKQLHVPSTCYFSVSTYIQLNLRVWLQIMLFISH